MLSEEAQEEEGNLFHLGLYAKASDNLDTVLGSYQLKWDVLMDSFL